MKNTPKIQNATEARKKTASRLLRKAYLRLMKDAYNKHGVSTKDFNQKCLLWCKIHKKTTNPTPKMWVEAAQAQIAFLNRKPLPSTRTFPKRDRSEYHDYISKEEGHTKMSNWAGDQKKLDKLEDAVDKLAQEYRCDSLDYLQYLLERDGRKKDAKLVEAWRNYWKKGLRWDDSDSLPFPFF